MSPVENRFACMAFRLDEENLGGCFGGGPSLEGLGLVQILSQLLIYHDPEEPQGWGDDGDA